MVRSLLALLAAGASLSIVANAAAVTADVAPQVDTERALKKITSLANNVQVNAPAQLKKPPTPAIAAPRRGDLPQVTLAAVPAATATGTPKPITLANATALPETRLGVAIAESVSTREQKLAEQGRELALKEKLLKAAEARAARKLSALNPKSPADAGASEMPTASPARAASPGSQAATKAAELERIQGLARIYQAMKPARAAAVFEKLEVAVQVQVAREMSERSVAQILNLMDPASGAKLSMALANRAPRVQTASAAPSPAAVPGAGKPANGS